MTYIKSVFDRKICCVALHCVLVVGACFNVFANTPPVPADQREALNWRQDSLNVEKQMLLRQGQGQAQRFNDLEERTARMRDSIEAMRAAALTLSPDDTDAADGDSGLFGWLSLPEFLSSLRPASTFDWIVVATGGVAILALFTLVIGLVFGRKKKRGEPKKKHGNRKINLAPTGTLPVIPGVKAYAPGAVAGADDNRFPTADTLYNLAGRTDVGPADTRTPAEALAGRNVPGLDAARARAYGDADRGNAVTDVAADPLAGFQSLMENLRKVASPPADAQASADLETTKINVAHDVEPEPLPLVTDAPDEPEPEPPTPRPQVGGGGTGAINFTELVMAAAKTGLDEIEISRRYQLSVDQVRLILRMNKK